MKRKGYPHDASDIDANHSKPGRVTPAVNAKTRRKNLKVGNDLGPEHDIGERWLVMAIPRPRNKAAGVYFVATVK